MSRARSRDELRGDDRGLIRLHRAFHLFNERTLRIRILLCDGILFDQCLIALESDPGVRELRLIAGERALRLEKRGLERPRIDDHEELAALDHLTFVEEDLRDDSGYVGPDGTVASGVTVPSASSTMGTSDFSAVATPTVVVGRPGNSRPPEWPLSQRMRMTTTIRAAITATAERICCLGFKLRVPDQASHTECEQARDRLGP